MFPKFVKYLLFFLTLLLIIQLFTAPPVKDDDAAMKRDVELTLSSTEFRQDVIVKLSVKNNSNSDITIAQVDCQTNPLNVFQYAGGTWQEKNAQVENGDCLEKPVLKPGEEFLVDYSKWNHDLFGEVGKYKIEFPYVKNEKQQNYFVEFSVTEPSFIVNAWNVMFYKPIYNSLILFVKILPHYSNLGFSIILLTLLIKLILLVPNTRAIRSQQEMQKIQPLLAKIKAKYAGDQQKISKETMKIWKEHKVNPFGSCLPLFIQLPVMLALFYVAQSGVNIEENMYLVYESLMNGKIILDPIFLGVMDLTEKNYYVLPIIVGGLQYYQMSLSLPSTPKKEKKDGEIDQAQMMNSTMKYVMPLMVAVFTASLPAAVGLYWGTSTLFALVQQMVLTKKKS